MKWVKLGPLKFIIDRPYKKVPLDVVSRPGEYFRLKPLWRYYRGREYIFLSLGVIRLQLDLVGPK